MQHLKDKLAVETQDRSRLEDELILLRSSEAAAKSALASETAVGYRCNLKKLEKEIGRSAELEKLSEEWASKTEALEKATTAAQSHHQVAPVNDRNWRVPEKSSNRRWPKETAWLAS